VRLVRAAASALRASRRSQAFLNRGDTMDEAAVRFRER